MTHLKSLLKNPTYLLATALATMFLIGNWLLVKSQNPTTPGTLQGQTQTVTLRPWGTVHAGRINYSLDTDHDGMPDEVELANGLDPNNPADADGDLDGDGLTNGDEVTLGTGLQTLDSDGDGVSDAEEVRQGYNPLDATSTPPAGTQVVSLQVSPTRLGLSLNTLLGNIPAQLTVTGTLSDGSTVDLTRSPGTSYQSLNASIAAIDGQGSAVGIAPGITTIQVRNGLLTTQTNVVVSPFTPRGEGRVEIPGFANNVDVSGNFAFVASGAAGLQVVDASNPAEASVVASVQLPGTAVDVRVAGALAYIAAGDGGLQIVDISDPYNPQLVGGVELSRAIDVVVKNNRAYVAAGIQGLQIVDITTPTNPTLLGSLSIPDGSKANGVDVDPSRNVAVVVLANLTTPSASRLLVVDVADPLAPTPIGSLSAPQVLTRPQDVVINGTAAYVVDARNVNQPGLIAIDISNPTQPAIAGLGNLNFDAFDIEVHNSLAFTATQAFTFAQVPMFSVTNPLMPSYVGAISPSRNEYYGSGIAVNDTLVFLTSSDFRFEKGEGETATSSFLLIGRYRQLPDTAGMPPIVNLVRPFPGETLVSGDEIEVVASAFDDTGVALIEYRANGQVIGARSNPPTGIAYTVPAGLNELTFEATATDYAANTTTSTPVTFQVIPDPLTTVVGYVVDESFAPVEGVTVAIKGQESLSTVTDSFGGFSISGVGTIPMTTPIDVIVRNAQGERLGTAVPRPAVRGGFTDLGAIQLFPPAIEFSSPAADTTFVAGETVTLAVKEHNGVSLASVEIYVNGVPVQTFTTPPYSMTYVVPNTENSLTLEARAVDTNGNVGRAVPIQVQVVQSDPLTTVIGAVTDVQSTPVPNVPVVLDGLGLIAVTDSIGQFRFENVATIPFGVKLSATINDTATGRRGRSAQVAAVRGSTTDLGTIQAAVIRSALLPSFISGLGSGDHTGDNLADVFIGFADQPAAVYQSDGTGNLTPGSTLTLPFSTVRAGTSLRLDSTGGVDILAQPVGTPGTATIVLTDGAGGILNSIPLETGLDRDSELIVTGFDSPDFFSRRPVVAFAALTGGMSITVRVNQGAPDQFSAPIVLPTTPEIPIRSLLVQDVTGDQLADIVGIEEISSTDTRLIVFPRTGTTTFGAPIESSVIIRNGAATVGTADITIASFGSGRGDDIAVLGDDRVRIYSGDGSGSYTLYREILLPENTIARGIGPQSRQLDGPTVLAITVSRLDAPLSRILLLYDESGETPHTVVPYDISSDVGETRIGVDELGGSEFRQFDVVVIDGRTLTTFFDIGPPRPSE